MSEHTVGTREEWLAARKELLAREKELTRRSGEVARERRELPWVPVEKGYAFESNDGTKTLPDLIANILVEELGEERAIVSCSGQATPWGSETLSPPRAGS
jgi:predicted dithiol-disulfide oxidoreductase (DUF899 family)